MLEVMDEPAQDGKELEIKRLLYCTISRIIDKYFKYVTLISYCNSFYNQWMLPLILEVGLDSIVGVSAASATLKEPRKLSRLDANIVAL
jgi:hypothetical protein